LITGYFAPILGNFVTKYGKTGAWVKRLERSPRSWRPDFDSLAESDQNILKVGIYSIPA